MSIKALPSMEHTFTLNVKGSITGQHFDGTFTYKRPSLRGQSDIAKMASRLNEDLKNLDEDTKILHNVLSNLRHTLIQAPEWWKACDYGYELYDVNVIMELYKETVNFENKWFEKVWGNQEEPGKEEKSESGPTQEERKQA